MAICTPTLAAPLAEALRATSTLHVLLDHARTAERHAATKLRARHAQSVTLRRVAIDAVHVVINIDGEGHGIAIALSCDALRQTRRRPLQSWQRREALPVVSDSVLGDGVIGRGGTLEASDNFG